MSIAKRIRFIESSPLDTYPIEFPFSCNLRRCISEPGTEVLVKQSFRDECNVNLIVSRFTASGVLPTTALEPRYEDVSGTPSFQDAMQIVVRAQEAFNSQPPEIRARFSNDPAQFVAFVDDPANRSEAERLGLVSKPVPAPVVPIPPTGNVPS